MEEKSLDIQASMPKDTHTPKPKGKRGRRK